MENEKELENQDFMHAHNDTVEKVKNNMPEEELLYDLAELYKVFGDTTRIKILYVLSRVGNVRVRHCTAFKHEHVGHFAPASGAENLQPGEISAGRQNGVLFPGRRPRENHYWNGYGAY